MRLCHHPNLEAELISPFVLLHADDNVLVCRMYAAAGTQFEIDGSTMTLLENIMVGHKIARHALKSGDKVLKYGAPIGSMIADVAAGGHVHMHNMKSDYIASHTRSVVK